MKYRESNLDKRLRNWFANDNTKGLLRGIEIAEGGFRGLTKFKVNLSANGDRFIYSILLPPSWLEK